MSQQEAPKPSVVETLDFGPKTAKRVTFEAWEFTIVGQGQIRVTNASYGYLKNDHQYVVEVEKQAGVAVPVRCECPADEYDEKHSCKHRVASAAVGGETVLNAAIETELRADGGEPVPDGCTQGVDRCKGPRGDVLPCFACFSPSGGSR